MKRLIILIIVALIFLSGCSLSCNDVSSEEKQEDYGSFTSKKSYSYDKKYYAVQTAEYDGSESRARGIIITVYNGNDEKVYSFSPARAFDFWGICWEKDSYNIWVQSGDTGVVCYKFSNEKWLLDESAQKPDYIITKYEAEESKDNG